MSRIKIDLEQDKNLTPFGIATIQDRYLDKNETINHFYILDLNPKGFILVSADNKVNPILGYSFNNNLDINSLPLQLQNLFESYKVLLGQYRHLTQKVYYIPTHQIQLLLDL